jgi:hypothetical protein
MSELELSFLEFITGVVNMMLFQIIGFFFYKKKDLCAKYILDTTCMPLSQHQARRAGRCKKNLHTSRLPLCQHQATTCNKICKCNKINPLYSFSHSVIRVYDEIVC